jgi:hypothetical protein
MRMCWWSEGTALGSTQPPIQWIGGALSLKIKRLGREADHSPPYSAEIKECVELYLHTAHIPLKTQGQFTFTFQSLDPPPGRHDYVICN